MAGRQPDGVATSSSTPLTVVPARGAPAGAAGSRSSYPAMASVPLRKTTGVTRSTARPATPPADLPAPKQTRTAASTDLRAPAASDGPGGTEPTTRLSAIRATSSARPPPTLSTRPGPGLHSSENDRRSPIPVLRRNPP
ncbi:hypothetical protein [Parafrankia sp. BMG5.11]|uniref:hypothetical protein n=1 Tax=Parafrankia sp. BMG5.11 TaxID=222540 RepID=UPI000DD44226|nr:hypothetical protein [Parafrankia sp. BMG5.11]